MKLIFLLILISALSQNLNAWTIELGPAPKEFKRKPKITGPAVLDARGAFDYASSHVENSVPIRWEDFSQSEMPNKGLLDSDIDLLARKLRVVGIEPNREVIVIGNGEKGWGEEGRVAWMLKYLGVKKITLKKYDDFKGRKSIGPYQGAIAVPMWKPEVNAALRIRRQELEKKIHDPAIEIVDVRESDEFSGEKGFGESRLGHLPHAKNIPWKRFLGADGLPKSKDDVLGVLTKAGVDTSKEIIFYCTGGVRSGYATFIATESGLTAKNFDGSIWEWAANASLPLEKTK